MNNDVHYNQNKSRRISRITWGAIFAGGLTALAVSLLLNLLGVGIGFSTINPLTEADPLQGLGTGTIIWWVVSNIIALFAGGFVAGRTAGFTDSSDGGLHGFLSWGFYATVSFLLFSMTASSIMGGITGTVSSIFSANKSQQKIVVQTNQNQMQQTSNQTLNNLKGDVLSLIRRGEQINLLPNDASEETTRAIDNTSRDLEQAWNDLNLDQNIDRFLNDLSVNLDDSGNLDIQVDGEYFNQVELKEYLSENTDLTQDEINGVVNKWETKIDNTVQDAERLYGDAKQKAIEYSDKAANTAAKAAIGAFFAFLIGIIAAYFGGVVGSPNRAVEVE